MGISEGLALWLQPCFIFSLNFGMDTGFLPEELKLRTSSEWIKLSKNCRDHTVPLKWFFTQHLSLESETPCMLSILTKKKRQNLQLTENERAHWQLFQKEVLLQEWFKKLMLFVCSDNLLSDPCASLWRFIQTLWNMSGPFQWLNLTPWTI